MPGPKTSKINVLVADDDPVFSSLVEARLVRFDCNLLVASNGSEAWHVTRQHILDLALVDFEMPGLDGISLTRCLRSHPQTRHIPIVMCTSRTDGETMLAALEAGVSSFMTKPVNWSLFERHIRHLLHLGSKQAELERNLAAAAKTQRDKDAVFVRLVTALNPALQALGQSAETKRLAAEAAELIATYLQLAKDVDTSSQDAAEPSANAPALLRSGTDG